MFTLQPDAIPEPVDAEFSRPVESIMRCEDFKSNFARRLSNRYISRSPVTPKRHNSLILRTSTEKEIVDNAPEIIEHCSQLSKIGVTEQNGEVVKPPDKPTKNLNIRDTKVNALNMEIETLRWQLSQTEANRQMHIALLKQVVNFLSRVKERIECQNPEAGPNKEPVSMCGISPTILNVADLPRSKSVLHVNKHDYSLNAGKKLSSTKMSKSICNVNGFKDSNAIWNQSKLSLNYDSENTQKITEEITRLISLANTVLCTKLPDLACKCVDTNDTFKDQNDKHSDSPESDSHLSLNLTDEETANAFILNTIYDGQDALKVLTNKFEDIKEGTLPDFIVTSSSFACGLENDYASLNVNENNNKTQTENKTRILHNRCEYNHVTNFIEDESGFSSMSSFQEIGIPIISIIPPSPCKEVGYIEELAEIIDDTAKWKTDPIDLDKQTVKVFWV